MDRCFKHLEIAKARLAEMKSRLYLSRRLSTTERAMELGLLSKPQNNKERNRPAIPQKYHAQPTRYWRKETGGISLERPNR